MSSGLATSMMEMNFLFELLLRCGCFLLIILFACFVLYLSPLLEQWVSESEDE